MCTLQQISMTSRALLAEGARPEKRGSSESKVDQELFPDFIAKFVDDKTLLSCVLDLIKVTHERDLRSDWSRLSERLERGGEGACLLLARRSWRHPSWVFPHPLLNVGQVLQPRLSLLLPVGEPQHGRFEPRDLRSVF